MSAAVENILFANLDRLYLRVHPSGTRTWMLTYYKAGKKKRYKLEHHGTRYGLK